MKPEQFIREQGLDKAREVVASIPVPQVNFYSLDKNTFLELPEGYDSSAYLNANYKVYVSVKDLKRLVESLDRYNKFDSKQEALDAIDEAPEGATDYRKLSCGARYIKQGPRFFEYWNGSEWCRPTVPFTVETHILRFDKLDDLKQAIKDHESIYGEEQWVLS
ncbi:hypothetical protein [Acinetobacter calcoaceticus]|uniref:hypothetical protein n=1 Tax=Acinetobacter calcoaceticus TaxID=471 RepID=UPI0018DE775E|nr:hypothetical protein [Acinetobacter calcoaceticus]